MVVKIDKFGRLLIPKRLRRQLGLQPGEPVDLETSGKRLIITPSPRPVRKIGIDKGVVKIADDFDEPLDDFQEYMY